MVNFKIGQIVRLTFDNETIYEIIEINPLIEKGILIRVFGSGNFIQVDASKIFLLNREVKKSSITRFTITIKISKYGMKKIPMKS